MMELPAPPARQDRRVTKVHPVLQVSQVLKALRVLMELLEPLALLDHKVLPASRARLVLKVKRSQDQLVRQDRRVTKVLQASRARLVRRGPLVPMALRDQQVRKAIKDHLELQERPVPKVQME